MNREGPMHLVDFGIRAVVNGGRETRILAPRETA
jgi:hypothetical protein